MDGGMKNYAKLVTVKIERHYRFGPPTRHSGTSRNERQPTRMDNDYIFFDASLVQTFVEFVTALGASTQVQPDSMSGWVVQLQALPEAAEDTVEAEYARLMLLQRDLVDAADGDDANDVLGVEVSLPDGQSCWVRIPAALGRRLTEHFSFEEIHQLVGLVADQALQPVAGPICRKI